ncbi:YozQ family protein [Brevibacillus ruminantium]|uniref:YozQ family protein n=1 Tax=Brevibacillus ruminantium TaxID=2950604 RepID=UPI003898EAD1
MPTRREEDLSQAADEVATNNYQPSDYQSSSFTEKGLAVTHEQVSDDYMEGNNDPAKRP